MRFTSSPTGVLVFGATASVRKHFEIFGRGRWSKGTVRLAHRQSLGGGAGGWKSWRIVSCVYACAFVPGGLNKNKMGGLNKCRSLVVRSMVGRGICP